MLANIYKYISRNAIRNTAKVKYMTAKMFRD